MAQITPQQAGGVNVVAFLDMLAWSEGTDNGRQPTRDRGYDVLVGGQMYTDYADHPRVLVDLPRLGIQSTAAGRYQLLRRYFDAYRKSLGLKDFTPLSQDLIALQQIRERRALPLIQAGKIAEAIAAVRNIWASLPGAGYGQHEHRLDQLLSVFARAKAAAERGQPADFTKVTFSVDSTAEIVRAGTSKDGTK
ncbi:glycoside hydrolase family 104 protein [Stenotrophomonas sp. CFBP 13718]|nr:glycoside hydrolase family 104 protein [Stenotrophomonas sp. CFBP 13718]